LKKEKKWSHELTHASSRHESVRCQDEKQTLNRWLGTYRVGC